MDEVFETLNDQQWLRVDNAVAPFIRTGVGLADFLEYIGQYEDAFAVLLKMKVGECIRTGISVYERIR